nr:hypothetical protein [Tanacetum cinerariifolium]
MTSFDYRFNPLYPIKECSSCRALYTADYCYSEGSLRDRIIYDFNKTPDLSQRPPQNFPQCGNPVDGQYCQGCALLRKKFKEDLFKYCIENGILQVSFEPSNDNTNIVNALQEPFVVKQDPCENFLQSPPQINHHCCYGCGDSLECIFCYQCTCELCGKGVLMKPTNEEEKQIEEEQAAKARYWKILVSYDDDDEDYTIVVTPILSTEEPDNSLSMRDEHLDTVSATESNEFINYILENLVPSEPEVIPENMCDMPFHDNSLPLDVLKDQFEDFSDSNDDFTSIDDDSFSINNIEYVEASLPDSELVSLEVMEIVIPEVGGIDDDILLTIKDDILHEKLLHVNLLIANIEALKDNPTPSSNFMTNTTTHSDYSLYDSFIFDLSINPFPPANRSDFYEFDDELAHIISPPEYDCFCFKNEPNTGDFTMDMVEDIFPTREPRASPLDSELISSEVMEIVILEEGGIDADILLIIKDDILLFISSASLGNYVSKSNRSERLSFGIPHKRP